MHLDQVTSQVSSGPEIYEPLQVPSLGNFHLAGLGHLSVQFPPGNVTRPGQAGQALGRVPLPWEQCRKEPGVRTACLDPQHKSQPTR